MAGALLEYMSKNQILFIIPFCMLGGVFLRLRGFLVTEDTETLSKVTFNFFLPVIILIALTTAELSLDLWRVLVSSLATQFLAGVIMVVAVSTIFRGPELKSLRGTLIMSCMAADIGFAIPMVLGSGIKDSFVALVIWDLPFNAMTGLMFNKIIGVLHSTSGDCPPELLAEPCDETAACWPIHVFPVTEPSVVADDEDDEKDESCEKHCDDVLPASLEKQSDHVLPTLGIVGPGQGLRSTAHEDFKADASDFPVSSPRMSTVHCRRMTLRESVRQSTSNGDANLAPLAVAFSRRVTTIAHEPAQTGGENGRAGVIHICLDAMKGMAKDINIICMFVAFVMNSILLATDTKHEFPTFLKTSLFSIGAGFGTLLYIILGLNFRIRVMMPHLKVAVPLLLARTFLYAGIGALLFVTHALPNKAAQQAVVVALLAPVNACTVGIAIDCGLDWELQTTVMLLSMLLSSVLLAVAIAFMTA